MRCGEMEFAVDRSRVVLMHRRSVRLRTGSRDGRVRVVATTTRHLCPKCLAVSLYVHYHRGAALFPTVLSFISHDTPALLRYAQEKACALASHRLPRTTRMVRSRAAVVGFSHPLHASSGAARLQTWPSAGGCAQIDLQPRCRSLMCEKRRRLLTQSLSHSLIHPQLASSPARHPSRDPGRQVVMQH